MDQFTQSAPPERKRGIVTQFATMDRDNLASMAEDLNLAMSLTDLRFCQHYFAKVEQRDPTLDEIYFLDAIVRERKLSAYSYLYTNVSATDGNAAQTYRDLNEKKASLAPAFSAPLAPKDVLPITATYLRKIGGITQNVLALESNRRHDVKNAQPIPPETAIMLLLPEDGSASATAYEWQVQSFTTAPTIATCIRRLLQTDHCGIACTLANKTTGIFADLSRFAGEDGKMPELSCLAEDHIGRYLLFCGRDATEMLAERAPEFGLRAIYFAKVTLTGRFALRRDFNPHLMMDLGFLRALAGGLQDGSALVKKEELQLPTPHLPLEESDSVAVQNLTRDLPKLRFSTVKVSLEASPFSHALNAALDAVIGAVCAGANRRNLTLLTQFEFPIRGISPESLGDDLSAMLGVYRACIELSLLPQGYQNASGNNFSLLCLAAGTEFISERAKPADTLASNSLYFLPVLRRQDGMPDFDHFRRMCDYVYHLYREKKIYQAYPVSGELSARLTAIAGGRQFTLTSEGERLAPYFNQGILLEGKDLTDLSIIAYMEAAVPETPKPEAKNEFYAQEPEQKSDFSDTDSL